MSILKSKIIFLSAIMSFALLYACKKYSLSDALPQLSIKSVTLTSNDSAIVRGTIINEGGAAIEYEGVCYGLDTMPDMTENQHFIYSNQTNFSITVKVHQDSIYFFRVYATNYYGYTITKPVLVKVSHNKAPQVPCTLSDMKINDGGANYNVISAGINPSNIANYGNWEAEADYGSISMFMDFWGRPTNGAYVTQVDGAQFSDNHNSREVYVQENNFNIYSMQTGDSVYVTENSDSSLSLSFCGMHYDAGSSKVAVKGKFTVK